MTHTESHDGARRRSAADGRLRELLRRGDPAGDGREPSRAEIAAWRSTLEETARRRGAGGWRPAWALLATTVLAVAAIALWSLRPSSEPAPAAVSEKMVITAPQDAEDSRQLASAPPPDRSQVAPAPAPPDDADALPLVRRDAGQATAATAPVRPPAPATGQVTTVAARRTRTVRFTAPGGTRIVWTLDSEFSLSDRSQHKGGST